MKAFKRALLENAKKITDLKQGVKQSMDAFMFKSKLCIKQCLSEE